MNKPDSGLEIMQLRILFGPLFGSDIAIPPGEIFFCVGEQVIDDRPAEHPENHAGHLLERAVDTLYIPHRAGAPNFRLRFPGVPTQAARIPETGEAARGDFEVDFLSADGCVTQCAAFNTVCRFGDIAFALRRQGEPWSEAVARYAPHAPSRSPDTAEQGTPGEPGDSGERASRFALKLGALLVVGVALAALAYWQVQRYVGAQKLASVNGVLAGAPAPNAILPGDDGRIYVLSASQDGAEWDREALLKAALPEKIEVAVIGAERQRIERRLDEAGVDFVTVRLDTPERPELILTGAAPVADRARAIGELRRAAPYVRDVRVIDASLGAIEQEARNALDKAGARYRLLTRRGGATFEVATSFGDEELAALQNLMRSFSHKWGTRRVDFKIALRTDWLKGKSYREGGDGYVLLDHASWYFPQPLEGAHSR
ncbi:PrgH/EprH family type III secretion apparatus protein [Burkholderia thailandensis]|uniref:PrgH/EprH family type III secretion apparatus protein n=1 Tax=Burkholderia thailandensis TaxID=57975 RepID=UPI00192D6F83|nr:PrgH/EprH family type III secretion apparatus protein [Burkholderia thailandensis]MBS2131101.1 PrgH/EprH family type III secretion apparatus protein [Burkholderia thailandensis]MCS6476122.1 PrgH/EprH family type III secretion apparatus protein [Burkholderia thailandensis]QRA15089.1 PrgH/EprH family type III secretion apparatus protein [Burkholderia thailandensis]WRS69785.1 PrgH/EprH family type III secretion apparatus protein [Burkholderia thailandensis]